ncbi:GNAT family N-acetyltransferase [Hyunsoonleella rubra]|uniref:GNAT family N-acetyltransferase n=1 Tax=Hyunsoonleella rubra TaxID=1737062 RepID=A0ABW5TDL7_9FLAO
MEKGNTTRFYRLNWMWNILRHGLFLKGVNNRIARIGLDFMPYYWVLEGQEEFDPPQIRGDATGFEVSFFDDTDIAKVQSSISGLGDVDYAQNLRNGEICVGLRKKGKVAAFMFIKKNSHEFRGKLFPLKDNEAYLYGMYTFESFRGKNLAPYLRYHCYQLCREDGIHKFYSVSDYLNKSTLRFKGKLKAKNTRLYLSMKLFKSYYRTFLLKKYN